MVGDSPVTGSANGLDEASKDFVGNVIRSGLVDLDRIRPVVASLIAQGGEIDPQRVANGLINAGLLTAWQAKNLLAGRSRGFFLGSYRLLRPLGIGGMGVVYLGEHKVMQRRMALKILPRNAMEDKVRVARFQAEARAAAQLDHVNIVRAYDFGTAGGKSFIVMEYVEGVDLHRLVDRDGPMSPKAALDAIYQAANGLSHAHQRGIIHRDIKPSNLMMRHDGVIKVSDMGLARIGMHTEGSLTMDNPSSMMGTADFLAPEQALDSHTVDGRADIYALGCTLYYLLTGQTPYPGGTLAQRIAKHQTAAPADIRKLRANCPPAIAELAMHMMAKRPEDRVRSANELIVQLQRIAASLGFSLNSIDGSRLPVSESSTGTINLGEQVVGRTDTGSDPLNNLGMPSMVGGKATENQDFFDLSDLPEISVSGPISLAPVSTMRNAASAANASGQQTSYSNTTHFPPTSFSAEPAKSDTNKLSGNQGLMIGIGLTLAIAALISTGSMIYWTITREPNDSSPATKIVEYEKGKNVVIVEN